MVLWATRMLLDQSSWQAASHDDRLHIPLLWYEHGISWFIQYSSLYSSFRTQRSLFLHPVRSILPFHRAYPTHNPRRKVAMFSPCSRHCWASLAMLPTDGRPPSRTTLAVWEGQACLGGFSVADTEDSRTELQAHVLGRAVETRERHTAQKDTKWPYLEENRECKDILCLSHTYLVSTKIYYGYLESVKTMEISDLLRPNMGYPKNRWDIPMVREWWDIPMVLKHGNLSKESGF